ncbi:Hypothetical protein R9X50_00314300 [Acrodontium crateriforme]|uniref:Integral membrane bound transporter domain-containing protein n=1 Tax=Acrodontium crateriforme TaxID=150365 RepID=A0AAQ3M302_9PEZI|nr:Hypothetical protein R9X50_00314300 [Acrodontium crateriforme]
MSTGESSSQAQQAGGFFHRKLRRASFITPFTGERSKRAFTLREASNRHNSQDGAVNETTPLFNGDGRSGTPTKRESVQGYFIGKIDEAWKFWTSKTGLGIFKCSLAYLLGSLVTFVPVLSALVGQRQDSKHMVASCTVWFHAARTIGSMHEATVLAVIALCFSGFISFTSMGISMLMADLDMLPIGHAIVLIVFLGGGLGFIAWTKLRLGQPLVNVATALASLGCISVLVKEGSVQAGTFSVVRPSQILFMVMMGVAIVTAVNILVFPTTARGQLNDDLEKNTDLLGEMLISITRAFLAGQEDLMQEDYHKLSQELQKSTNSMQKNVTEAQREYYVLGQEKLYSIQARLVTALAGISQDLGGLRSAALAQFSFIKEAAARTAEERNTKAKVMSPRRESSHFRDTLSAITEVSEESEALSGQRPGIFHQESESSLAGSMRTKFQQDQELDSLGDMFLTFINQLGPPTKSLVYTLKQILDELPFKRLRPPCRSLNSWVEDVPIEVAAIGNFHSSLKDAIELYRVSRKEALTILYQSRAIKAANTAQQSSKHTAFTRSHDSKQEVLEDIEEVSACCGHFSFSLLDLAESVLIYLDLLQELKNYLESPIHSWSWLMPWRKNEEHETLANLTRSMTFHEHNEEHDNMQTIPSPIQKADDFADPTKSTRNRRWTYRLYKSMRIFRRDDVLFAIKVGIGAILYALPAFLESTRPFFEHWRGEWGLVSYMAVCCMTIGASNTTGLQRIIGTFFGACLAIIAWIIASHKGDANPWFLGFFGWLVALGCFWLILAKGNGPMGRFILLTYNLGALYSYSLSIKDDDNDDDEGGIDPAIWDIVLHRLVAVIVGCIWGIFITRFIWPISARKKLKSGLCVLWLRMGLIWKRDPLAMFLLGEPRSSYMDIREEASLQSFLLSLDSLRQAAKSEFEFKGPFPDEIIGRIIERTGRMLSSFHAMNVVISKNLQYTRGEAAVLRYTRQERFELSARISHLFSVLASSVKLEYPLNDALPSIDHTRDRLLGRMSEFRRTGEGRELVTEQDFELLYAYVLVTGQLSQDIRAVSTEIENLFGTLNEENLKLQ